MPSPMSCEEIDGHHREARRSHSEKGFLTRVQQVLLGSHNGGPLLYDKFLTIDSLQLHPPFDVAEKARLDNLTALDARLAKRLRWCMDPLVGLGCALAAIMLQLVTEKCWQWRIEVITAWFEGSGEQTAYTMFMACAMGTLVALAMTLVACIGCWWQPTAASSGIPGVIAFLNGCEWAGALRGPVLVVKVFGTALACAAGLFVGPEGPMIHAGTIVGMLTVNRVIRPTLRRLGGAWGAKMDLELAREPLRYHFQAAAMGAGAGVAAAFCAPLAGTIFIIEEAASYFSKRLFFHSLLTCCIAVLITKIISDSLGISEISMYNATTSCVLEQRWRPLLLLQATQVGVLCGILAAFFNRLTVKLNTMRALQARRLGVKGRFVVYRFLEVVALTVATTAFSVLVPAMLPCRDASLQTIFSDSSGCIPEEWQAQLVAGSKAVSSSRDVYGPRESTADKNDPRLAFIPAPGLFGVQFNPENCSRAVQLEPRCNITQVISAVTGSETPVDGISEVNYCCGFRTLDELAAGVGQERGNFFSAKNPHSPLLMKEELWPSDVCPSARKDGDNFGIGIPQYSPTAALLLANPRAVVRNILTHGPQQILPAHELALYLFGYFVLASFTSGAWVPSGLVLPMMIIGACAGRLSGLLWFELLKETADRNPPIPWILELKVVLNALQPEAYNLDIGMDSGVLAMAGAAAFLSGSGSLMLFVVVLILELTWDPFIIPVVLLSMVVARVFAAMLGSSGLYHELIEVQSFPYLAENEHWRQRCWLVRDVLDEDQRRGSYFAGGGNWADETDLDINRVTNSNGPERQARQIASAANGATRSLERVSSQQSNMGLHSMPHSSASLMMFESTAAGPLESQAQAPSELRPDPPRSRSKEWNTGTLIYLKAHSTPAQIDAALKKVLDGDERPVANAFPVVEDDGGVLCGCVSRSSLEGLMRCVEAVMEGRPSRRQRNQPRDSLGRSLVTNYESELQAGISPSFPSPSLGLSAAGSDLLDVAAVMDASPFTVREEAPVTQARMLFRQLGLRHLVVIDSCCRPVGILTRKSLMPWRTPWREHSFVGGDTFLETRAMHSPMGSPQPSRRTIEQEGP